MGEKCEPTGTSALPGVADLWPPASPVTRNNAVLQLRLQFFALPVANDHQLLLNCGLIVLKHIALPPPTTDLRPRTGGEPPVQQHAQACCEPLTLALGPEAQGPRHATSCREMALPGWWISGHRLRQ